MLGFFPNSIIFTLPVDWFDNLPDNTSVFNSLYRWMVNAKKINKEDLHNTYAGSTIAKKLLAAERKRLSKRLKIKGEKLDNALWWSDANSGPRTEFAGRQLLGSSFVVLSDEDRDRIDKMSGVFLRKDWEYENQKIKDVATGKNFHQWLLSNSGRKDKVGNWVEHVVYDSEFPSQATDIHELSEYMYSCDASEYFTEALKIAWEEYSEKYPDRTPMSAWCDKCNRQILDFSKGFLELTDGEEELSILHQECLHIDYEVPTLAMHEISKDDGFESLADFGERYEIPSERLLETERQLRLWGFWKKPSKQKPKVYFIQAGFSGDIKIGFSYNIEKRLKVLQTSHSEKLRILAALNGDRIVELELHQRFGSYRKKGEWFEPHPELMQFISVLIAPASLKECD